ncbi:MAG: hypothetical protein JSW26_30960 [Desulfobacterales bacterium]|nr:MAG: hypothetical protein JSW26_30960 [Desulfobacterales bacterium]
MSAHAQSIGNESPALPANSSDQKSFWENIDTRFGGRLRTTGRALQVDNDTIFAPVGTGTYWDGSFNFRLINETFFTDTVYTDVAYELIGAGGDTVRKTNELQELFPNLPANIYFGGTPLDDDQRLMDLTGPIVDKDSYFLVQRLDRLYLAWLPQWGSVKIGRQAVTWGNGFIFNPFDLFNPFPPTQIDREYKVGDDMLNVQFSLPKVGDLQGLYVVRRNPDTHRVASDQSSLAGKLHFAAGTTEFDVMAARNYEDYVMGLGSRGYIADAAWRLDGTWMFLNDDDDYLSLAANMDYSWVWFEKNFYGFIEYYFNGLGKDDYQDAVLDPAIVERLMRGELFVLGRHYLSSHIEMELHPLFKMFFTTIHNVEDPSGILQPYAAWDITQNLQMTAGVNISYGAKGSEFGGFILPGTDIRTQSPDNAYLWLIYYF